MNYLVKSYIINHNEYYKPSLEDILSNKLSIIKQINSNSLFDINKILIEKELPIINNMFNFRKNNIHCIYRFTNGYFIYLLSDNDINIKQKIRDIKLSEIIENK